MNKLNKIWIVSAITIVVLSTTAYLLYRNFGQPKQPTTLQTEPGADTSGSAQPPPSPAPTPSTPASSQYAQPVAEFVSRVTKKPFGIYITPKTSPVQPERFTGYHTGADAEYQDTTADVPVYAFSDGKIVLSETASGYGGVFMLEFNIDGVKHTALYGHIQPSSSPKVGRIVSKGEQIALLGTGYSVETDGERRHLHFAILSDNSLNIKGYVPAKSQLSGWIDPLTLFP